MVEFGIASTGIIGTGLATEAFIAFEPRFSSQTRNRMPKTGARIGVGWSAGVTWSRNETIRLSVLDNFNGDSVDFLKSDDDLGTRYTYRSHYDPKALVQIGRFRFDGAPRENGMMILVDGSIDRRTFDFSKAVKAELDWLISKGVIRMSAFEVEQAAGSIAENGSGQFWTGLRRVLPPCTVDAGQLRDRGYSGQRTPGGSECGNPGVDAGGFVPARRRSQEQ